MTKDYYEILGVPRDSDEDAIRAAYRKLAHLYHPDKTGGDKPAEDKLKEINEAYDVLKNKEKRARYDRFGSSGAGAGAQGFGGGFGAGSPFDDIFDAFFSGTRGGGGPRTAARGDDLEYRLHLSLREAAHGTSKTIRFKRHENCQECSGSGAAKGSGVDRCTQCGGTGQVRMSQGFFSITRTCPRCQGAGGVIKDPCPACGGSGSAVAQRELTVKIPPGVDTGSRLRMSGEGEGGRSGGPRGDLYVFLEVEEDEVFTREGNDLLCEVPVSFSQAILGAEIKVPSLDGETDLKIPAGTQSGTVFRMRSLGIPDVRGYHKGDLLITVEIETPTKLTKEQKELIRKFEELSSATTYPLHKRFLDRIRKSFGE
jgi:molecular chaperone DnaJ